MKRLVILILVAIIVTGVVLFIRRSIPYSDRDELFSATIKIDSIWSMGPATTFYDKTSRKYYWLKSLTPLDQEMLDTLKSKKAHVRYMKFLMGPFENRIFRMEVDSIVIIDQVIERE
jgi:hypothetical protein